MGETGGLFIFIVHERLCCTGVGIRKGKEGKAASVVESEKERGEAIARKKLPRDSSGAKIHKTSCRRLPFRSILFLRTLTFPVSSSLPSLFPPSFRDFISTFRIANKYSP